MLHWVWVVMSIKQQVLFQCHPIKWKNYFVMKSWIQTPPKGKGGTGGWLCVREGRTRTGEEARISMNSLGGVILRPVTLSFLLSLRTILPCDCDSDVALSVPSTSKLPNSVFRCLRTSTLDGGICKTNASFSWSKSLSNATPNTCLLYTSPSPRD